MIMLTITTKVMKNTKDTNMFEKNLFMAWAFLHAKLNEKAIV
jgi:hypothetical protein